ncbi:molybdopterin cofactor-binding domain-containing protein [Deinococcus oregonensis]|uniref:Molybdopterin cofactor-binding domain-containing protein n=1 Tax=Deinococcus oregonensis TaxID=1805970 RepID=A0ABV6AYS4_9DEIO
MSPPSPDWQVTRRRVLIGLGGAGTLLVGALIGLDRGRPAIVNLIEERGTGPQNAPTTPDLWFEITPEHLVFYSPKVEMGQGIHTALAQIAAEELEVSPSQLDVRQAPSSRGFDGRVMFTFGSSSVNALYTPLRQAAATLREMLRAEAARQLDVPANQLSASGGCFFVRGGRRFLSYGDVVAAKQGEWTVPDAPPILKEKAAFTTIGRSIPRVDVRAKLLGEATYGYDARVPGMLYGAVARPPRYGARLSFAAPGQVQRAPGVVQVVIDLAANFAGVVADTRTQARAAVEQLNLRWEGGTTINQDELERLVTADEAGAVVLRRRGNVGTALRRGTLVEAQYRTPLAAHAHLEPLAALAQVQGKEVKVWVPTQYPERIIQDVQATLGRGYNVTVYPTLLGGSFGRKAGQSAAPEAARLSAAVGRPVHVGWTREEDLRHGFFRLPTHTVLRGSVDGRGRILGVEQFSASGNIVWNFEDMPGGILTQNLLGFDPGVLIGRFLPYDLPNYRVVNKQVKLPVLTGPWRGLGLLPNTFALESFVDELAHAAGVDPLAFRLRHLPQTREGRRFRRVLETAAQRSGWGTAAPPGRARGIACCMDVHTAVAQVAEVSVEQGQIRVHRITAAVDPGFVVNPQGATLQATGSIVMGLSSALKEQIQVRGGMMQTANFDTYPLLTLAETPEINVVLVESGEIPYGMGEPVIGAVAPAVANAVFALTGTRTRTLPLALM